MTIDIISAAQADRQLKLDQILALHLDVIEIDAFIARARSYAGQGEAEEITSDPSETKAIEAETPREQISPPESAPVKSKLFTAPISEDRIKRDREVIERRRRLGLV